MSLLSRSWVLLPQVGHSRVWASAIVVNRKDLVGTYAGASAGAAVGVSANAPVGGSHITIVLQLLSREGSVDPSIALGVTALTLR